MRARRGTTLIEAMIAVTVLAVGVAGVAAAMIATAGQDRRNSSRAAAMTVATDTAQALARLPFADTHFNNFYAGPTFGNPKVASFTQAPGNPPTVTDTWVAGNTPTYGEASLATVTGVRTPLELNTNNPGRLYLFNRYYDVLVDPNNVNLKIIAVHVTYASGQRTRAVATVFTSVFNEVALSNAFSL